MTLTTLLPMTLMMMTLISVILSDAEGDGQLL